MKSLLQKIVVLVLVMLIVVPAPFLVAPQKTHAVFGVGDTTIVVGDVSPSSLIRNAQMVLTKIESVTTAAATYATYLDEYYLEPMAFVLSGEILKSITAGVLSFISKGRKGHPMFVQDLRGTIQKARDVQNKTFISQFKQHSRSPFADQIAGSLRKGYFQNSSLSGFFAKNKDTLLAVSPNPKALVQGNLSKGGGWKAWFALTTECNNDPYCLQYRSQKELSTLTSNETQSLLTRLNWGQGFFSWCGGKAPTKKQTSGGKASTKKQTSGGSHPTSAKNKAGRDPGDTCTKSDGSPGTILTPGSVIKDELRSITNANILKVTQLGKLGPSIKGIIGNFSKILKTVRLGTGVAGLVGGIVGINNSSSGGGSALKRYESPTRGYFGVNYATVATSSPTTSNILQQFKTRTTKDNAYWDTISNSVSTASSELRKITSSCSSTSTQAVAAKKTLNTTVLPALNKAAAAFSQIRTARQFIQKIQTDSQSGNGRAYTLDLANIQSAHPTATEMVQAQQDARVLGSASANPEGSLNVSGGTLVDRMNLITQNANNLYSQCILLVNATSTIP